MSAGAVKAGSAYVELSVKDKMKQGLDEARSRLDRFSQAFGAATGGFFGGLIGANIGAVIGKVGEVLNMADAIADSSARIGMSAESFQELGFAAQQSGTSIESVSGSIRKFQMLVGKAELGNKQAIDTLKKYGLSLDDLKGMTPEKQLQAVADVIASMPDQTSKAAAAIALLGRGGVELLPLLSGGAGGIRALNEQARALGLVSKEEDIQRAGRLADVWDTTKQQLARVAVVMYNALVPAMEKFSEVLRGTLAWTIAFIDNNRGLVRVMFGVIGAIGLATGVYYGYQLAALGASAAMGLFAGAQAVATAGAVAFNVATGGIPILLGSVLAAIIAAVAGMAVLSGSFSGLGKTASDTFGGIYDAIAGANFGLAWQIAVKGMELAWVTFTGNIMRAWDKAVAYIDSKVPQQLKDMARFSVDPIGFLSGTGQQQYKKKNFATTPEEAAKFAGGSTSEQEKLRKELEELNKQAKDERAKLASPETQTQNGIFDIDNLLKSLDKKTLSTSGGNPFSQQGTFSSAAFGLLGGSPVRIQEKLLKEAEKQTEVLENIEENIAEESGVFS